jgi:hypothetical protein
VEPDFTLPGPRHPFANFTVAAIVTAVWLLALMGLAAGTANPVTVNRHQIEIADLVVTGRVLDRDRGDVMVERTWKGNAPAEQLRVANLAQTLAEPQGVYILPLSPEDGNEFVVTPARRRRDALELDDLGPDIGGPLLVYPATAEAVEQLEQALGGNGNGGTVRR